MRELVSATFAAGWPAAAPGVPLLLEDEAAPSGDSFAALTITSTTGTQMTHGRIGNRKVRRQGWIQVKLWGPADEGAAGIAGLSAAVLQLLEMVSLPSVVPGDDPVTTLAAQAGPSGTDGRWFMGLVRIPLWYVQTK